MNGTLSKKTEILTFSSFSVVLTVLELLLGVISFAFLGVFVARYGQSLSFRNSRSIHLEEYEHGKYIARPQNFWGAMWMTKADHNQDHYGMYGVLDNTCFNSTDKSPYKDHLGLCGSAYWQKSISCTDSNEQWNAALALTSTSNPSDFDKYKVSGTEAKNQCRFRRIKPLMAFETDSRSYSILASGNFEVYMWSITAILTLFMGMLIVRKMDSFMKFFYDEPSPADGLKQVLYVILGVVFVGIYIMYFVIWNHNIKDGQLKESFDFNSTHFDYWFRDDHCYSSILIAWVVFSFFTYIDSDKEQIVIASDKDEANQGLIKGAKIEDTETGQLPNPLQQIPGLGNFGPQNSAPQQIPGSGGSILASQNTKKLPVPYKIKDPKMGVRNKIINKQKNNNKEEFSWDLEPIYDEGVHDFQYANEVEEIDNLEHSVNLYLHHGALLFLFVFPLMTMALLSLPKYDIDIHMQITIIFSVLIAFLQYLKVNLRSCCRYLQNGNNLVKRKQMSEEEKEMADKSGDNEFTSVEILMLVIVTLLQILVYLMVLIIPRKGLWMLHDSISRLYDAFFWINVFGMLAIEIVFWIGTKFFTEEDLHYKSKREIALAASSVLLFASVLTVICFIAYSGEHIWNAGEDNIILKKYLVSEEIYNKMYVDHHPGQIVLRYWVFGRKYEQPENGYLAYSWKEIWGT